MPTGAATSVSRIAVPEREPGSSTAPGMVSRAVPPLTEKRLELPARDQGPPLSAVPRPFETVRVKESVAEVDVAAAAGETAAATNATRARTATTTPVGRCTDMAKAPWSAPGAKR